MSKELPRHERRPSPPQLRDSPFGQCNLTPKTILGFLSTRALRGGPRLVIQLVLALLGLILLAKFFTSPTSDAILHSGSTWSWSPFGGSSEKTIGNGRPGGVRIVAFGSPDVATPANGKGKGWTEMLCEELSCSSHKSLVPSTPLPAQALTAHSHYASTIEKVTRELEMEKAPGYDYDFILEQFPLTEAIADVTAQVDAFLAQKPPRAGDVPKETVWVFSFGTWDVWTLATLPRELGDGIVDLAVRALFAQVERVYQASLDTSSVAFSDFWAHQDASLIEKINRADAGGDEMDARELENFRVVVPELFDVSLTPGWHAQRPAPPAPHSKAEQMTNAAHLTERWNMEVHARMREWAASPDPQPAGGEGERGRFGYVAASNRASPKLRRAARNLEGRTVPVAAADDDNVLRVPFPRRVGAQVNSGEFVREAMIENQMRQHSLTDSTGRGNRTEGGENGVSFAETWTPCIWAKTDETPEADGGFAACDVPGDYLFHSPFTLGERAIRETARVAAAETRKKLAYVDPVEEKKGQEEKAAKVKREEPMGEMRGFQHVLRPSRVMRIVDAACPTLDVC
ncbi:hypothetical protein CPLU01_12155 [Colletotrichum plurivorum]|uniref:Uncharacterized protein n=1 Tax=Colletotrichum plurivorum TaxID=2175906 RepID=A0A8H6N7D7_9PEZI|nr:hypothetical protein CPLU01_12155 [Colletotrichum plurivorum]